MAAPSPPHPLSATPRNAIMPDLDSLLERLLRHHVELVVVGGFAAVAHGASILTQDIDLCCPFTPENLLRIQEALEDLHPVWRMTPARLPLHLTRENCKGLRNLYLETDWGQLDCLGTILGVGDYEAALAASLEIELPAGKCRILNLDALIQAKLAMGRARDKETVFQLRSIQERTQQQ
jgi:hypothetical protein